jgi:hypothetical protein
MLLDLPFAASLIATLFVLGWRGWARHAPLFMAFLFLNCVQAVNGMIGKPHGMRWWHNSWTPIEFVLVGLSILATVEILFQRTNFFEPIDRFWWRFAVLVSATGVIWFFWHVNSISWYGWLVYAREYVWIWVLLVCAATAIFFYHNPVVERRGLRTHYFTFSAWLMSHAIIAPMNRIGLGMTVPQHVFQAITICCCASWIIFCAPTTGRPIVVGSSSRNPASPAGLPSSPGSHQR